MFRGEIMKKIHSILNRLSSKSICERKKAIKELMRHIRHKDFLARLSLHYVSVHDPSYSVRNIARQAFYKIGEPPSTDLTWDKAYLF
jgi:hypothetical protein